jgi:cholesterol transport system auxiliary component
MKRALATAAIVLGACGCALTSRGNVLAVRYFAPDAPGARLTAAAPRATTTEVRLGQIRGASHLRERIAHRESPYEVGFYDDLEWTERPDVFVRRALARKLFEERRFERAMDSSALTLDVEVLAFEEVRMPRTHAARVTLRYELHDELAVRDEQTITIERPISGDRVEDFVRAISEALEAASDRIADRIAQGSPE